MPVNHALLQRGKIISYIVQIGTMFAVYGDVITADCNQLDGKEWCVMRD